MRQGITPWTDMRTLIGALRSHALATIRSYESAQALLLKFVHVQNGRSKYLGGDRYGFGFMTQLGVLLGAVLSQGAMVSRLISPPHHKNARDAMVRARHVKQALDYSREVMVDRQARNNLEHIEQRLNAVISIAHTMRASSFSEGLVITRFELAENERRIKGPALFCWALVPDEMTLITIDESCARRETHLPTLINQIRDIVNRCERWLRSAREPGTKRPFGAGAT